MSDEITDLPPTRQALEEDLRSEGVRVTKQRLAILEVMAGADDHPTAEIVLERARLLDPSVSLTTVYRTLNILTERGAILRNEFEGAPARFELSNQDHHDHIIDIETGAVIEFVSTEIEALQMRIARVHGYEIVSHRMELYCKKRR